LHDVTKWRFEDEDISDDISLEDGGRRPGCSCKRGCARPHLEAPPRVAGFVQYPRRDGSSLLDIAALPRTTLAPQSPGFDGTRTVLVATLDPDRQSAAVEFVELAERRRPQLIAIGGLVAPQYGVTILLVTSG
jgi:hypothetical protein